MPPVPVAEYCTLRTCAVPMAALARCSAAWGSGLVEAHAVKRIATAPPATVKALLFMLSPVGFRPASILAPARPCCLPGDWRPGLLVGDSCRTNRRHR